MKTVSIVFFSLMWFSTSIAQNHNPKYNKTLADSLGADAYGMKSYVLVLLKTGTNQTTDETLINKTFKGHLENINRLANLNKLVVAGPMGANEKNYRGIFILNVKSLDEARTLLETDPAIQEKLLEAELYPWYGSAALPAYLDVHYSIEKEKP